MKFDFDEIVDRKNTNSLKYDFAAERGRPADVLPLWVADMDLKAPPAVIDALKQKAEHGIFGYSMPKSDYFETVAKWFKERHGWVVNPDNFMTTPGVVFAICTLLHTVTKPDDAVIICQPVYYPFANSIKDGGRTLVVSELKLVNGRYEIDFDDFERKIVENRVKAFILCSPHNPVGRVWTKEELEKLGDICLKHGVFVIADEIHADFTFGGHRHIPFCTIKEEFESICAVCTAPSKTFNLAGLQISNVYFPDPEVKKKFCARLDAVGYWEPNIMGLVACAAAYEKGGEWLDELKTYLDGNLKFVREYLAANLPKIKLIEPEGTYLLWLDCRELNLSAEELQNLVEQGAKLWLDDGYIFGAGGEGFERVNIACPRATLDAALSRLAAEIHRRKLQ